VNALRTSLLALAAAPALWSYVQPLRAQDEVVVASPRADSVAVTIYRDDLALITETRNVDLPAAAVTLVIDDVVETLLPQSAIVADSGRALAESNFDFDRLTPRSLLERSIGQSVTITRTNPANGRVTRTAATIVAVGEGVVLQTADGIEALYCSGLPERLELTHVPDELLAKPRLSVKLAAGEAGPRTVKVSYLAHGFAWSSDYVAHLNQRSDAMSLTGWATLVNSTGTVFEQAEVQLVAGALNILDAAEGGSSAEYVYRQGDETAVEARQRIIQEEAVAKVSLLRDCFTTDVPLPPQAAPIPRELLERIQLSAQRAVSFDQAVVAATSAERETFGDYQLYRLPWRTDLAARQTKQALFVNEPEVEVERFYGFRLASLTEPPNEDVTIPNLTVRFENTEARGLGEPLPSGIVRVFEDYGGRAVFAGEAEIGDRPIGLPVELTIGRAQNVMLETTADWERGAPRVAGDRIVVTTEHRIVNNKSVPIELEIRHGVESYYSDLKVDRTSRPMRRKYGDLAWRFTVQPGEELLTYRLSARELGY
jgi:hypothetical protein